MLVVDEQSKSFQREVIDTLIKKIIDLLKIDLSTKNDLISQITSFLNNNQIFTIESLLQNSTQIAKILKINPQNLNEIIQKNYFKILQQLKKEKENINLYLKDEKQNIVDILSKYIFPSNLSDAYYKQENELYILYLPSKKIVEKSDLVPKESEPKKQENNIKKPVSQPEEKSILKELLETFPNIQVKRNLVAEIESLESKEIEISHTEETKKTSQNTTIQQKDSESIITEILTNFSNLFPISKDLQKIVDKQDEEAVQFSESKNQSSQIEDLQEEFIPISFSIAEYVDLRKKLQNYKNDSNAYANFIKNADQNQKSVIAILNIISRESDPNFSLENYLENVSIKLNVSKESIRELYYRIKKYNLCIGFLKQASDYLKKSDPKSYNYFLNIYEPLLDFISLLNNENQEQFLENNLDKNLKLLLISITDENDRQRLLNFLKKFVFNIRKYI